MSSKSVWSTLVVAGFCAAAAVAQPPTPPATPAAPADRLFFVENLPPLATMAARIDIVGSEGGVPGPVIKGKPYSARAITESTQVLADGNRITQRNEAVFHRDAEGRTRREQTLGGVGAWRAGEPVTLITIHDPIENKTYTLDPAQRIARQLRPFQMAIAQAGAAIGGASAAVSGTWNVAVPAPPPVAAPVPPLEPSRAGAVAVDVQRDVTVIRRSEGGRENVQVFSTVPGAAAVYPPGTTGVYAPAENLGEQVLEGLLVKGTRMTDTIPAGVIGNERPIEIVTERWFSEDIDAMVLQRFADPRVGETVYRLVNVVRGEPSPDLFQVPQGYEIKVPELPRPGVRVRRSPGGPEAVELELQHVEPAAAPQ